MPYRWNGRPAWRRCYSDIGFLVLGFVVEAAGGGPLDDQFDELRRAWDGTTTFRPSSALLARIAPTEYDAVRDRVVHGYVHDENARALGGVAGHAGLFGTASDVGAFARLVLRTFREPTGLGTPSLMRTFATECLVPSSSRALGWDTMRPTSSCGSLMSRRRDWTHWLHRHVAVDRSRARLVRGVAHEPDPSDADKRRAPCASSPRSRCDCDGVRRRPLSAGLRAGSGHGGQSPALADATTGSGLTASARSGKDWRDFVAWPGRTADAAAADAASSASGIAPELR